MKIYRALGLTLAMVCGSSVAASFDCSKASGFAEVSICKDGYLTTVDDILNRSYTKALSATADPQALRQSQRQWLLTRDACTTQKCLDSTMGARVTFLDNYVQNERRAADNLLQQQQAVARAAEQTRLEQPAPAAERIPPAQAAVVAPPVVIPSPAPSYAPATRPQAQATSPQPEKTLWKQFIDGPAWKYALLTGFLLSCWAVWRHHKGTTTIYNDYTDAAISNGVPLAGFITAAVFRWLELPAPFVWAAAGTGVILAIAYSFYASIRVNHGGLSITLSIITKLFFISVFYAVIGMLIASLFVSTKYKGESQARANARNRREKKQTRAQIAALTAGYTALTIWLCRRPEFTSLSECLDFELTPEPA